MPRTPTPYWNELTGKAYDDLLGLIEGGELDADIADWLDTSEEYVAAVRAELAAIASIVAGTAEINALIIRQQAARQTMARDTASYNNPPLPTILNRTTAAGRRTLSLPGCTIIIGVESVGASSADLDLNTAATWDTLGPPDYHDASTRAGVDFCIYVTDEGDYLISAATDAPDGFTSADSHKIGGFSCVPVAIVSGFPEYEYSGFLPGDIIPASIWDINPATVPAL